MPVGGVPTLPVHFFPMGDQVYTKRLTQLKRIVGLEYFTKLIHGFQKVDHRNKIDRVFQRFVDDIFAVYDEGYKIGQEKGFQPMNVMELRRFVGFGLKNIHYSVRIFCMPFDVPHS